MSAPVRFLAFAVVGWVAFRAMTLGELQGGSILSPPAAEAAPPPIVPTQFPPLPPVQAQPQAAPGWAPTGWPMYGYVPVPVMTAIPIPYAQPMAGMSRPLPPGGYYPDPLDGQPGPNFYAPIPKLDEWQLSGLTSSALPPLQPGSSAPVWQPGVAVPPKLDRWQLSAWALLRGRPGTGSLASGGTLGGSQAGARLTYSFDPRLAASLRSYSPVGGARGGEIAAGLRVTPFPSIPVSITAERRQAIGRDGGRSAFALFAEGGLYQQPLPWAFSLDAYAQAGVVGLNSRDLFADGSFTIMRPLFGRFSAGMGMWGGVQPDLYRVDAGPRLSVRVRDNMRIYLDWRQRIAGTAEPGSGPALTLAGDF